MGLHFFVKNPTNFEEPLESLKKRFWKQTLLSSCLAESTLLCFPRCGKYNLNHTVSWKSCIMCYAKKVENQTTFVEGFWPEFYARGRFRKYSMSGYIRTYNYNMLAFWVLFMPIFSLRGGVITKKCKNLRLLKTHGDRVRKTSRTKKPGSWGRFWDWGRYGLKITYKAFKTPNP